MRTPILIRIAKCGKTSILESIRNEDFVEDVPSIAEECKLGPGYSQSNHYLILNDTSCK